MVVAGALPHPEATGLLAAVQGARRGARRASVEPDQGVRPGIVDDAVRHHGPHRKRHHRDDAGLEVGDDPAAGAVPDGDDPVAVPRPGARPPRRPTVAGDVAQPGHQRFADDVVADALGVKAVHALAGSGGRRRPSHQHDRRGGDHRVLWRDPGGLRDGEVPPVLGCCRPMNQDALSPPRFLVAILLFVVPLSQIPLDIYTPALPQMVIDLHSTPAAMQGTVTAYMLGMSLAFIPVGVLADAWGRKPVLLTCLVVVVGTSLLCAVASNVPLLLGVRFVQGAAACSCMVLTYAIAADCFSGGKLTSVAGVLGAAWGVAP